MGVCCSFLHFKAHNKFMVSLRKTFDFTGSFLQDRCCSVSLIILNDCANNPLSYSQLFTFHLIRAHSSILCLIPLNTFRSLPKYTIFINKLFLSYLVSISAHHSTDCRQYMQMIILTFPIICSFCCYDFPIVIIVACVFVFCFCFG